jgi:hypothetical protein
MAQGRVSQEELLRRADAFATSEPIIFDGATAAQLGQMFRVSGPIVRARLTRIRPCGKRDGFDIYAVADAATVLTRFDDEELVERVLRLHADELPKALSREFWNGQLAKLTFEERTGELWSSKTVIDLAGDVFKTMRLSLMLLADTLEREADLNPAQRLIIERLVDELLDALRRKLVDGLENRRDNPLGKPVAQSQDNGSEDL